MTASLAVGMALYHQRRFAEAEKNFRAVLAQQPNHLDALIALAAVLIEQQRAAEALPLAERAVKVAPTSSQSLSVWAGTLITLKRFGEALDALDRALALNPADLQAQYNRGVVLTELGRLDEALAAFDRVLARASDDPAALYNKANVLARLRRYEEALEAYGRILAKNPRDPIVLTNRGAVLAALGRPLDALDCYERAIAAYPQNTHALNNRGNMLKLLGRLPEALASFDRALAIDPRYVNALFNRGNTLLQLGEHAKAKADFDNVLAAEPNRPDAMAALMNCCASTCDWPRMAELTPPLLAAALDGTIVPFPLLNLDLAPAQLAACMRSYAHRNDPATVKLPRKHERRGKIKLAYLSSDFREHPISVLIARLIELHDRADFEVIGISFGIDDSPIRQRLIASFDRFHDARLQSDREVADLIASLEVDIVVDLNGRTDDARPGVLALRPAPIAVNFLGVAGNTGAEFLDYIIADRIVLPDAQQQFYSENVVYLPDSYLVNDAGREISAHVPTRAEAGLPPDGFVFCAFNNSFKIQPAVFSRWMRLLARVEGSVLWLSRTNDVAIANLRGQAEAHGIDPARLIFAPRIPSSADHLARHRLAGLFVDTLPFNAHTTGADALWAGLPIVTCLGGTFPGRVAASMLHAVGLPELVTHSLDDYEALAIKLAEDPALLDQVRRKLEQNRRTCALFDNDRYRRHLEAAYRTMCEISWRGEAARGFGVKPDGSIASYRGDGR